MDRTNFFDATLRVLHVAPEFCLISRFTKLQNLDYVTVDLSSRLALVKMDLRNLGFSDSSFDCVICCHVLEHVPEDRIAIRELFRVLNPGGYAIIQSPIDLTCESTSEDPSLDPAERSRLFGQADHVRIYGRDYSGRLESAGFIVKVDAYAKALGTSTIEKFRLSEDERIYFCVKPNQTSRG